MGRQWEWPGESRILNPNDTQILVSFCGEDQYVKIIKERKVHLWCIDLFRKGWGSLRRIRECVLRLRLVLVRILVRKEGRFRPSITRSIIRIGKEEEVLEVGGEEGWTARTCPRMEVVRECYGEERKKSNEGFIELEREEKPRKGKNHSYHLD
ncbi:hypothetical protein HAX54_026607 [Datura stramonium]|uniref:Uncharacterized protein n=1 Tax=Datura stramonium TaxID=4076 RepID=A0ABS8S7Y8_DATST|nr:hypothetical protein [Datura stramonium]